MRAARQVYAAEGPDVALDAVAKSAGVGERTLYRHFPSKAELIRAALDQSIDENLTPAIDSAVANANPLRGLEELLDAAISLGSREHHLLVAARKSGALADISGPLNDALGELAERALRDGLVRQDLVADDLPRVVAMVHSVLWTMDPTSDGWRRYLTLMLDAITVTDGRPLPPAVELHYEPPAEWPL